MAQTTQLIGSHSVTISYNSPTYHLNTSSPTPVEGDLYYNGTNLRFRLAGGAENVITQSSPTLKLNRIAYIHWNYNLCINSVADH